jgi:SAM-dependent methyltransferase
MIDDVIRFAVPWSASVALVGSRESLPQLPGATVLPTPTAMREWFARLPARNLAYAATTEPAFADDLAGEFRRVVSEPGVCDVFALRSQVKARDRLAPDLLPYPTPEMIQLVAGMWSPHRFYQGFIEGGARVARRMFEMLDRAGSPARSQRQVLDFGCGCGRVMRQWKDLDVHRLHGTDYNPYLVEWCKSNLPFGTYAVNGLEPGIDQPSETFDLVYSYSVFTHLPEPLQDDWLAELTRVTVPRGYVWLTFHGRHMAAGLAPELRARLDAGELVIVNQLGARDGGTNACAAFHPPEYVRRLTGGVLDIVDFVPGDKEFTQDAYLLRKPA